MSFVILQTRDVYSYLKPTYLLNKRLKNKGIESIHLKLEHSLKLLDCNWLFLTGDLTYPLKIIYLTPKYRIYLFENLSTEIWNKPLCSLILVSANWPNKPNATIGRKLSLLGETLNSYIFDLNFFAPPNPVTGTPILKPTLVVILRLPVSVLATA